jgi:hypothetical protein
MSAEPTVLKLRWMAAMSLGVLIRSVLIYQPSKVKHAAACDRSEFFSDTLTLQKEIRTWIIISKTSRGTI